MNVVKECHKVRSEMEDLLEGLGSGTITCKEAKAKNAAASKTVRAIKAEIRALKDEPNRQRGGVRPARP